MALTVLPENLSILLLFDLDPDWPERERAESLRITSNFQQALVTRGYNVIPIQVTGKDLDSLLYDFDPVKHLVFNWCESLPGAAHGEWLVAKHLEQSGFTFTGAGSAALRLAQNKARLKQLLDKSGVSTPRWQKFNRNSVINWDTFPAIVKPSSEHCSEGIDRNSVCTTETELINRVEFVFEKFRQPVIVEDFIDGRELHVSLWGNGNDGGVDILPPAEMEFSSFSDQRDRLCSYESKFVPESVQYQNIKTVQPAVLTEYELAGIENTCRSAYAVAGCRDYARIDMRLRDGVYYILDINPNPDISQDTSTVSAAELSGYTYAEFGERIVNLATSRHPFRKKEIYHKDPGERCTNSLTVNFDSYSNYGR